MTSKAQLETSLENKCVAYAEEVCADTSTEDFWLFLGPRRDFLFVEFKRPGQTPTKKQLALHATLGLLGFKVWVIDTFDEFRPLVNRL